VQAAWFLADHRRLVRYSLTLWKYDTDTNVAKKPTRPTKPIALAGRKPAKLALEGNKWLVVRTGISFAIGDAHYDWYRNGKKEGAAQSS